MKSDPVLDELIGYRLRRAAVVSDEQARRTLDPFGLTPARLTALLLVRANPGCDQSALGRAMAVNRSSAMKLVNTLSERGLIERRPGRDGRSNALFLLPEGEAQLSAMTAALKAADEALTARLGADELAALHGALATLAKFRATKPAS